MAGRVSGRGGGSHVPQAWLEQAATLAQALPYMRRHAGACFVVKLGGAAMGEGGLAETFAQDVVLLRQVGIEPVVVHGGGPQIGAMLERLKLKSDFVEGLRITDRATVEVVEMVLSGNINKGIVEWIRRAGGRAVGLSGKDGALLRARRLKRRVRDPDSQIEKVLDLGLVGEPEEVTPHVLEVLRSSEVIPVVAPIGFGADGHTYNINADTMAGAVASALRARRLFLLTDVAGVCDAEGALMSTLDAASARRMIREGVISGGMIPKVETCLAALSDGVEAAVILDGRIPHVLLLEIFTEHGAGTLIGS